MMAPARKIVSGEEEDDEAETVEEVFAQARNAETAAEELLVDDGWKAVKMEPEAIAVNGNGNGHAPVPVSDNDHYDNAEEPQRSLFSWAEFMAEPVKLKSRKSKTQAPFLFEWAVEREREAELVGAGR